MPTIPGLATASRLPRQPGASVCSTARGGVGASALRAGGSALPPGWGIFVWGFCVGFKSIYLKKKLEGATWDGAAREEGNGCKQVEVYFSEKLFLIIGPDYCGNNSACER